MVASVDECHRRGRRSSRQTTDFSSATSTPWWWCSLHLEQGPIDVDATYSAQSCRPRHPPWSPYPEHSWHGQKRQISKRAALTLPRRLSAMDTAQEQAGLSSWTIGTGYMARSPSRTCAMVATLSTPASRPVNAPPRASSGRRSTGMARSLMLTRGRRKARRLLLVHPASHAREDFCGRRQPRNVAASPLSWSPPRLAWPGYRSVSHTCA